MQSNILLCILCYARCRTLSFRSPGWNQFTQRIPISGPGEMRPKRWYGKDEKARKNEKVKVESVQTAKEAQIDFILSQ